MFKAIKSRLLHVSSPFCPHCHFVHTKKEKTGGIFNPPTGKLLGDVILFAGYFLLATALQVIVSLNFPSLQRKSALSVVSPSLGPLQRLSRLASEVVSRLSKLPAIPPSLCRFCSLTGYKATPDCGLRLYGIPLPVIPKSIFLIFAV